MATETALLLKAITTEDAPNGGIISIPLEHAKYSDLLAGIIEDFSSVSMQRMRGEYDPNYNAAPIDIMCSYEALRVCVDYCAALAHNNGEHAKFEDAHMTNIHAKEFKILDWEKEFIGRFDLINNEPIDITQLSEYSIAPADDAPPHVKYGKYIPDDIRAELIAMRDRDESKMLCLKNIFDAAQFMLIEPLQKLVSWRCMEIIKAATARYNTGDDQNLDLWNRARHTLANLMRIPLAERVLDEKAMNEVVASLVWVARVYDGKVEEPMPDDSAIHAEKYTSMPEMPLIPTIDDVDIPGTITPMKAAAAPPAAK